ncbi:hypothetical protein KC19_2G205100 [Ceratodon purpureus]|uniref:Uncharacterized protein n=1 Tax=Ceratodon purpureus TaxID=3225 RepID=A0A8T0IY92_CERPU|nr:hypothetical protein KC19_2G205100 [Ceratodon purpureus]
MGHNDSKKKRTYEEDVVCEMVQNRGCEGGSSTASGTIASCSITGISARYDPSFCIQLQLPPSHIPSLLLSSSPHSLHSIHHQLNKTKTQNLAQKQSKTSLRRMLPKNQQHPQ